MSGGTSVKRQLQEAPKFLDQAQSLFSRRHKYQNHESDIRSSDDMMLFLGLCEEFMGYLDLRAPSAPAPLSPRSSSTHSSNLGSGPVL